MTANDATPSTTSRFERHPSSPARRGSASSISSRSSISQRSHRSPSPVVSFTPTPLSPDAKGVKDITRQVIRSLEGLGHFEFSSMLGSQSGIEEKDEIVDDSPVLSPPSPSTVKANGGPPLQNGHPGKPKKIDWEIPRKVLHSSIGFGTLYLFLSQAEPHFVIVSLWSALAIILPADYIRFRSTRFERLYERFLGFLMRESEKGQINGVVWYILGVNVALTFYPLDVATVAILILSWADTAASTIGRLWGYKTPALPHRFLGIPFAPRKSLAGFIAACITGAAVAIGFWGWIAPLRMQSSDITWFWAQGVRPTAASILPPQYAFQLTGSVGLGIIGLVAGLVSGVAEALDLKSLDDNLTLPIISGGCLMAFFKALSYFAP